MIPFAQELERYAEMLASAPLPPTRRSSPPGPRRAAGSDGDEADFEQAFAGFPEAVRQQRGGAGTRTGAGRQPAPKANASAAPPKSAARPPTTRSTRKDPRNRARDRARRQPRRRRRRSCDGWPVSCESRRGVRRAGDRRRQRRPERADRRRRRRRRRGRAQRSSGGRRLGLLLRLARRERQRAAATQAAEADPDVRLGHARLRAARSTSEARRIPRRERLPAGRSRPRGTMRQANNDRAPVDGAADPRHRRTGARSQRRDPAAPQPAPRCSTGSRAARARATAQRGDTGRAAKTRPLHPDPLQLRRRRAASTNDAAARNTPSAPPTEKSASFVEPNLAPPRTARGAATQGDRSRRTRTRTRSSQSGLFCAYNAGTTTVTISAGGLSASLPVTVQAGSVREPCGTVPAERAARAAADAARPAAAPARARAGAGRRRAGHGAAAGAAAAAAAASPAAPGAAAPRADAAPFVLPRPRCARRCSRSCRRRPPPARPTPAERHLGGHLAGRGSQNRRRGGEATESVGNQAVAYRAPEHEPAPVHARDRRARGVRRRLVRRPRRGRREVRVAPATISTMRAQRRMERQRQVGQVTRDAFTVCSRLGNTIAVAIGEASNRSA